MDPKSRPTFEELVPQLELMIHPKQSIPSITTTTTTTAEGVRQPTEKVPNQPEDEANQMKLVKARSRFDHDVYLVPGNSPSEKARCHYLSGRVSAPASVAVTKERRKSLK